MLKAAIRPHALKPTGIKFKRGSFGESIAPLFVKSRNSFHPFSSARLKARNSYATPDLKNIISFSFVFFSVFASASEVESVSVFPPWVIRL